MAKTKTGPKAVDPAQANRQASDRTLADDMPEPIPDTPENVLRAVLDTPEEPPGGWEYLKRQRAPKR